MVGLGVSDISHPSLHTRRVLYGIMGRGIPRAFFLVGKEGEDGGHG